ITTAGANELLVAYVSADGPASAGSQTVTAMSGAGLTWTMRARSNAQAGDAEIWTAAASSVVTNGQVTATLRSSAVGSITVVAFTGAATTGTPVVATASAGTGAPSVTLTTTRANSWVWGVGTDWSRAVSRTPAAGQAIVDQYLPSV